MPTPPWMTPAFSTLNWTSPPLAFFTAWATSIVTVPTLGFGIRLRGPRILPSRPTIGIMSGVAMQRSNSILPPWIVSIRSSAPTMSAPAAVGLVGLGAAGEDGDADGLAGAVRQVDDAADHLVGVARVDAEVHRDLEGLVELRGGVGLDQRDGLGDGEVGLALEGLAGGGGALCDLRHGLTP